MAEGLRLMVTVGRRAATIGLLALALSAPAMAKHKEGGVAMLEFEIVEGLAVVQVRTSTGYLRLLADTGSNATTLNATTPPGNLVIKLRDYELLVKPYPTQTPVFDKFNATLPKEQRLDGVLGQDFFSQFSIVAFDYAHHQLILAHRSRNTAIAIPSMNSSPGTVPEAGLDLHGMAAQVDASLYRQRSRSR